MAQTDVLLIALYDLYAYPVCILHSVLENAGFNVKTVFFKKLNRNNTITPPSQDEIDQLIQFIHQVSPQLVGISVRSLLFQIAAQLTQEIKRSTKALTIWGGCHPSIRPEECLEWADMVCVGEGEEAVVALCANLKNNTPIDNIKNLWVKTSNRIIKNELRPLTQDLDTIPLPSLSVKDKFYIHKNGVTPAPEFEKLKTDAILAYSTLTSRGCPFHCTYCCNTVFKKMYDHDEGKFIRRRSVENVMKELVLAKKMFPQVNMFFFHDDVFTLNFDWLKDFCREYKKHFKIKFSCYCHPGATKENVIKLLSETGLGGVIMGIQSGSEAFRRKYYNRHNGNDKIVECAAILKKYNISCHFDIIVDNPLESDDDKREGLDLLLRLPKPFHLHTTTLAHFPETDLTQLLLKKKIISEKDIEGQNISSYEKWSKVLDLSRSNENLFWDNLYYLSTKKISPSLILKLSQSKFLKKHPRILTHILRLTSTDIFSIKNYSKLELFRRSTLLFLKRSLRKVV